MGFIIFLLIEILIISYALTYLITPLFGAPYVPSKQNDIENFIKLANLSKEDKIVDLGSGMGRVVLKLAKLGYSVHGYEINPFFVLYSNLRLILNGKYPKSKVIWGNILNQDYSKYNVAFSYLFPGLMNKVYKKLSAEMPKGSRIISNTFEFIETAPTKQLDRLKLYQI